MDATVFQDLTDEETEMVLGGMSSGWCAVYGGVAMLCFATGNWVTCGMALLAAGAGGCFD